MTGGHPEGGRLCSEGDAMKQCIIILIILCVLSVTSWAGLNEGLDAFDRHDYTTALREFLISAPQGDAESQYLLATMYAAGQSVTKDYTEALRWYLRAAEQGYARAQQMVGLMYGNGHGVEKDYVRSFFWLSLAKTRLPPGKFRDDAVQQSALLRLFMTPEQRTQAEELIRAWKPKLETALSR